MTIVREMCLIKRYIRTPHVQFPPCFQASAIDGVLDFAVAFNSIQPIRTTTIIRAKILPIGLLSPALIIGVKGPTPWIPDDMNRPEYYSMEKLAHIAQPNLEALIIAWHLRHEQGLDSPPSARVLVPPLPTWAILFGVVYDARSVTIIAHIPLAQSPDASLLHISQPITYRYHSVILDTVANCTIKTL
jgi:hypothetical protein